MPTLENIPKVSVIIPAYNASRYIALAVESVLLQDYQDIETIIVDDGSTDDLKKALGRYIERGVIKYIYTENGGVSHAINIGLKSAKGDYVSFLHADDAFLPGKITRQVSAMKRFPCHGASYTDENYFLEGTSRSVKSPYYHFSGDIFYFLKRNNFIHISTAMFRKDVMGTERFDEGLACHEDWDIFLRFSAKGIRFLYLDEILSDIRVHPRNLSANTAVMDATRSEVGKRAKHLWDDFKKGINPYSVKGISNLKRYACFKASAFIMGFPKKRKFNPRAPKNII